MKSFSILVFVILLGNTGFRIKTSQECIQSNSIITTQKEQDQTNRCTGINKKGRQCGNKAPSGKKYCFWHDPSIKKCKSKNNRGLPCHNLPVSGSEYCPFHKEEKK